tara:strand:- start:627 stop:1166 length:540 start_codon:yes stop_codon:yes gene_type:complete
MKQFQLPYLVVVMATILFTISTIDNENIILDLENQLQQHKNNIDNLHNVVDSLNKVIDTLILPKKTPLNGLLSAIIFVESSYNDSAYCKSEDAVGCLQIRKTMVKDVNRILNLQGKTLRFSHNDRWSREKSIQMFNIYRKHYKLKSEEEIARCWNGGPRGMGYPSTSQYWDKVKIKINS